MRWSWCAARPWACRWSRRVEHLRAHRRRVGRQRLVVVTLREHVGPRDEAGGQLLALDGGAVADARPDLRHAVAYRRDELRVVGVGHDERGVGVVDHVGHLVGREPVRERHRHEPGLPGGMDHRDGLERVRSAPHDAVALLRAEREQTVREPVHHHVQLGEGGGRELRAVARVDDDGQAVGRPVGVQLQDVGHRGHGSSFLHVDTCVADRRRGRTIPVD